MTGKSLTPLLMGQQEKIRDFAVSCYHMGDLTIRHDEWSYHYFLPNARKARGSKLVKDKPELYNLREDPTEQHNLAEAEPDRAAELHRMLEQFTHELVSREREAAAS